MTQPADEPVPPEQGTVVQSGPSGSFEVTGFAANHAFKMYVATLVYRVIITVVVLGGAFFISRYAILPLTKAIAGQDTNFQFSLGVNISVMLNVALATTVVFSELGRRKANKNLRAAEPHSVLDQ